MLKSLNKRRFFVICLLLAFFALPVQAAVYPNDMNFNQQWYLNKIGAIDAWSKSTGSSDVLVAVLDTGVDLDNPDLSNNLWINKDEIADGRDNDGNIYVDDVSGWDFVDGDSDPRPDISDPQATPAAVHHGTLVAGIIGAMGDNSLAGTGINWRVKIMPLRVLDSRGQGDVGAVEEAIRYAIDKHADIINLSFVGPGFDKKLFLALRDAYQAGILVVAAVGNQTYEGIDLDHDPLYPVCYSGSDGEDVVLGVAAVDKNDQKPTFSNYGKNCVDISAPGLDIWSTMVYKPGQGYAKIFGGPWEGTSLAAPLVTGAAALLKAVNPKLKAADLRNILLTTADALPNSDYKDKMGYGRLNLNRAILAAGGGGFLGPGLSAGMNYILAAPSSSSMISKVGIMRQSGAEALNFNTYDAKTRLGLNIASGDIDGDGLGEIITGAGPGGGPQVRVFRSDGKLVSSFFAYDKNFRGGVSVAAGDFDGDGKAEIITGAGPGGGPHVRVFRSDGKPMASFFAYDKNFRGGVNVSVGDLNNDGKVEIIASAGPGMESRVKVFQSDGTTSANFLAFPANLKLGVKTAFGDVDNDGQVEILAYLMKGGVPEVRFFSPAGLWERAFMAYNEKNKNGLSLMAADLDNDGISEIIVGSPSGDPASISIFDGYGRLKKNFSVFDKNFRGGVNVGAIKL